MTFGRRDVGLVDDITKNSSYRDMHSNQSKLAYRGKHVKCLLY